MGTDTIFQVRSLFRASFAGEMAAETVPASPRKGKPWSFAGADLEEEGEVLPLSSLWIRKLTGNNPCILPGPGQGMGRRYPDICAFLGGDLRVSIQN
jgi:hypothetical protein